MDATIYLFVSVPDTDSKRVGGVHTNFIPESTDRHLITSLACKDPGKASAKARTRTKERVRAFRITTASADGYN
jgi:hypothetical protein